MSHILQRTIATIALMAELVAVISIGSASAATWEESFDGRFAKKYYVEPQLKGKGWTQTNINPATGFSDAAGEVSLIEMPTRLGRGAMKCVRKEEGSRMELELVNRDDKESSRLNQHCWAGISILLNLDEAKVVTGSGSYEQVSPGGAKPTTLPSPKDTGVPSSARTDDGRFALPLKADPEWENSAVYWEARLNPYMHQKPEWYSCAEAIRIADNVLLYQCDSGGWPKTLAFKKRYDITANVTDADRPALAALKSRTDSTIDNGSTYTEMEYLARVFDATKQERFKEAFLKGVDYLLNAQYENGGWPQFYPFPKDKEYLARIVSNRDEKDYFLYITFNDEAMVSVLRLLQSIARDKPAYAFVDADRRARCGKAVARGVDCILKCQVLVDGKRTGWCAQHDEKTLAPAGARVYEKVSLSGSEAVGIVRFLMSLNEPSPEVVDAVQSAVAWFDAVKIRGLRLVDKVDSSLPGGHDRIVVADPSAEPLWFRFYEIGTHRPIFCGNDGVIKRNLAEVEPARRWGYMWYCTTPADLLAKDYPAWQRKWAPGKNVLLKGLPQ